MNDKMISGYRDLYRNIETSKHQNIETSKHRITIRKYGNDAIQKEAKEKITVDKIFMTMIKIRYSHSTDRINIKWPIHCAILYTYKPNS